MDDVPIWVFGSNTWTASSVTASSSLGTPTRGIENSGASTSLINIETYVKAQLFIVNTVTNTAGATLDIPVAGLNTVGGATIFVPYATWSPLQATGQQHKIVMKVYVSHFKYKKGCWSGGNYNPRSNETTYASVDLVPITGGTNDWEKGWVDNILSPVIATWNGTQYLSRISNSAYESSTISINATLEAIPPSHPVNGFVTNYINNPTFDTSETLKVNVDWGLAVMLIGAGQEHSLGAKSDGTVLAVGSNSFNQCSVGSWTNIIAVSAGDTHSLGLRSNGTVVAAGANSDGQMDVGSWTNITAISTSSYHSLGLKNDGTVVAAGANSDGQCNVGGWTNIIAIKAGGQFSLGLKSDGTVVAIGNNPYGQLNTGSWDLIS